MLLTQSQVNHRIETQRLIQQQHTQQRSELATLGSSTKEEVRFILAEIADDVLLEAYDATEQIQSNILRAKPEHIVAMCYIEFELHHRGLPTRSSVNIRW